MLSPNTIEILKKLDKKELKRLREFIKSPYFNSVGKLEDLYDIIIKDHPSFSEAKLDDKKIFKKLYPGKEYKDKTVKNLYSEFGRVFRKFLAYEEISLDEDIIDLNLATALTRKGAFEISNRIINEKEEKADYKKLTDSYYLYIYKLRNQEYYNLHKENKFDLQDIYNKLNSIAENLAGFFLSNFSNTLYNMLFSLKTQNIDPGNEKLIELMKSFNPEKIVDFLDSSSLKNSDVIKLYYLFPNYLLNDFTERDYFQLKEILIKNADNLTKIDVSNFWGNTINIILLKLVPADKKYYREIFDISKFFCDLKIYPDDSIGKFPISLLRNIIFAGLILDEYEWTENFLNEYSDYIETDKKENEINYNKGILYFNYKKYKESIEYLSRVNFTDIYENVNVRFYYVMSYIELKYYDSAIAMIQSIRQLCKTNKEITELMAPLIKDSLRYLSEIIKCEEANRKLDYSIYKELLGPKRCYNKKYILNKMEQLV